MGGAPTPSSAPDASATFLISRERISAALPADGFGSTTRRRGKADDGIHVPEAARRWEVGLGGGGTEWKGARRAASGIARARASETGERGGRARWREVQETGDRNVLIGRGQRARTSRFLNDCYCVAMAHMFLLGGTPPIWSGNGRLPRNRALIGPVVGDSDGGPITVVVASAPSVASPGRPALRMNLYSSRFGTGRLLFVGVAA